MSDASMSDPAAIRSVILAGGKGTRLLPYTTALPKPLMPVGEMPILEIIVRQLKHFGFSRMTLSVGHLHALLRAYFGDGSRWGAEMDYSLEEEPLGTAGPVALVPDLSDTFLVMNGDLLCSIDYRDMVEAHLASGAVATIATYSKQVQLQLGVLKTENGLLTDYVEKPTLSYDVSMGIYVLDRSVLDFIPAGKRFDLPDLIKALLAVNQKVNLYPFTGYWRDIGTIDEYSAANAEFAEVQPSLNLAG
jgi:NDP-sugar pyrophosphorylase family protein